MDKCKWKEGKFKPCSGFEPDYNLGSETSFCVYCDTVINKPEPVLTTIEKTELLKTEMHRLGISAKDFINFFSPIEPEVIIKKSGETWVILSNGIDYMIVESDIYNGYRSIANYNQEDLLEAIARGIAVPISEIEITDEIAKLRPMVTCGGRRLYKLLAVDGMTPVNRSKENFLEYIASDDIELATVSDLK